MGQNESYGTRKNKAEGKRLCDIQHEEYLKFYDVVKKGSPKNEYHPLGGALQRDDKGKTYYFDSGKDYALYEPTIEQLYCLLTYLYNSMRFQIVCGDEVVTFLIHKKLNNLCRDIIDKKI